MSSLVEGSINEQLNMTSAMNQKEKANKTIPNVIDGMKSMSTAESSSAVTAQSSSN